eukprot:TRINITY_DN1070_c0_g1_i1.p6 TRINITY_DN1070_c0_g1~~TRINITY_DN1070_c0_g1_i1.p6  ORF type:complete len:134 (+),score=4.18 TRINITY_DN1070_c0_g1_i1:1176-1577(+)
MLKNQYIILHIQYNICRAQGELKRAPGEIISKKVMGQKNAATSQQKTCLLQPVKVTSKQAYGTCLPTQGTYALQKTTLPYLQNTSKISIEMIRSRNQYTYTLVQICIVLIACLTIKSGAKNQGQRDDLQYYDG